MLGALKPCLVGRRERHEHTDRLRLWVEELESDLDLVHDLSLAVDPICILRPLQETLGLLHLVLGPNDIACISRGKQAMYASQSLSAVMAPACFEAFRNFISCWRI